LVALLAATRVDVAVAAGALLAGAVDADPVELFVRVDAEAGCAAGDALAVVAADAAVDDDRAAEERGEGEVGDDEDADERLTRVVDGGLRNPCGRRGPRPGAWERPRPRPGRSYSSSS